MPTPRGLDDSQLVGQLGHEDVIDLLRSTFSRAEVATELPDHGTDVYCKIPAPGTRFYPVEWRIQVKASSSGQFDTSLTTRRAEQVLGTASSVWLLFFVSYAVSATELAVMDSVSRRRTAQFYVIDLRELLRDRLRADPTALDVKDEFFITAPQANRTNANLLVHLWATSLWNQVAGVFHGRVLQPDLASEMGKLANALKQFRDGACAPLSNAPDVNQLLNGVDPILKRPLRTPLHSYYGAHLVIARKLASHTAPRKVRGFSHLDKLDHAVCWLFSDWYRSYNAIATSARAGGVQRILELGEIRTRGLHERILAWQVLKAQVAQHVSVYLSSSSTLQKLESRTVFWPDDVSSTRMYNSGDVIDTVLLPYKAKADPIDWARIFRTSIVVKNYQDLYGMECLEAFGLDGVGRQELRGLGRPVRLLPFWWYVTPSAWPALDR